MRRGLRLLGFGLSVVWIAWLPVALAAEAPPATSARLLVTAPIDEAVQVELPGNTPPATRDLGAVADDLPLEHMHLQLKRDPDDERVVAAFVDGLHRRGSVDFHRWLTPDQFGKRFGLGRADLVRLTAWLRGHGLTVNHVYASRMVIDFSGTAGQVARTFHTPMRRLQIAGAAHLGNARNPRIPAALARAVAGVVSLHDLRARSRALPRAPFSGGTGLLLAPADLATIYRFAPAFHAGRTGAGQTVAVVEDSNLYRAADWAAFRAAFGLSGYRHGALVTSHPAPSGGAGCGDPGIGDNDYEATIDAEWASAAAPDATIMLASCAATAATDGVYLAIQNLVNAATRPQVISVSYGRCEAENGAAHNHALVSLYQQAAAEGISVFVATGDNGPSDCAVSMQDGASAGIGVNAWASTPYNVAVGGSDFSDTASGTAARYWGPGSGAPWGSAKSYVPEMPWNDTCASSVIASAYGYAAVTGARGFCNSRDGADFVPLGGGEGGPSGCASGAPEQPGVVGGSCRGTAKPSWQAGVTGIPTDQVRDVPDVALFAGDGVWRHSYMLCFTDPARVGVPCKGNPGSWSGGGGTSYAAPILAGVQALVNQAAGDRQGNPNVVYYKIAAQQYGPRRAACTTAAAGCAFHDIASGGNAVDCIGSIDCFRGRPAAGRYGVLSTSSTADAPAFKAGTGYDLATGLGSIDVANLLARWPGTGRRRD